MTRARRTTPRPLTGGTPLTNVTKPRLRSTLSAAACLATLLAATTASAAENFSFDSTAKGIDGVRVPATGNPFQGARVFSISTTTTYADARKEVTVGKCGSWVNAPGSMFPQSGICAFEQYTVRFSCAPASDASAESNCWGLLEGVGGRLQGRTGVIAYRSNATGSVGVGSWR